MKTLKKIFLIYFITTTITTQIPKSRNLVLKRILYKKTKKARKLDFDNFSRAEKKLYKEINSIKNPDEKKIITKEKIENAKREVQAEIENFKKTGNLKNEKNFVKNSKKNLMGIYFENEDKKIVDNIEKGNYDDLGQSGENNIKVIHDEVKKDNKIKIREVENKVNILEKKIKKKNLVEKKNISENNKVPMEILAENRNPVLPNIAPIPENYKWGPKNGLLNYNDVFFPKENLEEKNNLVEKKNIPENLKGGPKENLDLGDNKKIVSNNISFIDENLIDFSDGKKNTEKTSEVIQNMKKEIPEEKNKDEYIFKNLEKKNQDENPNSEKTLKTQQEVNLTNKPEITNSQKINFLKDNNLVTFTKLDQKNIKKIENKRKYKIISNFITEKKNEQKIISQNQKQNLKEEKINNKNLNKNFPGYENPFKNEKIKIDTNYPNPNLTKKSEKDIFITKPNGEKIEEKDIFFTDPNSNLEIEQKEIIKFRQKKKNFLNKKNKKDFKEQNFGEVSEWDDYYEDEKNIDERIYKNLLREGILLSKSKGWLVGVTFIVLAVFI